jgi:hypothetical protein
MKARGLAGAADREEGPGERMPENRAASIKTLEFDADFTDKLKRPREGFLFFGMLFA